MFVISMASQYVVESGSTALTVVPKDQNRLTPYGFLHMARTCQAADKSLFQGIIALKQLSLDV
jgi:hypothetical protein